MNPFREAPPSPLAVFPRASLARRVWAALTWKVERLALRRARAATEEARIRTALRRQRTMRKLEETMRLRAATKRMRAEIEEMVERVERVRTVTRVDALGIERLKVTEQQYRDEFERLTRGRR